MKPESSKLPGVSVDSFMLKFANWESSEESILIFKASSSDLFFDVLQYLCCKLYYPFEKDFLGKK